MDARKNSPEANSALRGRAVELIGKGWNHREIASALGVHRDTVSAWKTSLKRLGRDRFVRDLRLDAKGGASAVLTAAQARSLAGWITQKNPEQLMMPFSLWTRRAVRDLVSKRFGVKLSLPTIGTYLKKAGLTPQKPAKVAREQSPEAVERWLNAEYPAILARSKKERATIFWGDETGVTNQDNRALGYAKCGETPVKRIPGRRSTCSVISAITNKGEMRWMTYHGALNATLAVGFPERLVKSNKGRKVFLIWDNLRVHKGVEVTRWVEKNRTKIVLFHLPAYSPQLNPDERLNRDLKGELSRRPVATTPKSVRKAVSDSLASIVNQPERIKGYFRSRLTSYAA